MALAHGIVAQGGPALGLIPAPVAVPGEHEDRPMQMEGMQMEGMPAGGMMDREMMREMMHEMMQEMMQGMMGTPQAESIEMEPDLPEAEGVEPAPPGAESVEPEPAPPAHVH